MPRPGRASLFADLPFDAPASLPGWLVAIGGFLGSLGFLAPWAPALFGSAGFGSYFDSWGLASASQLPPFALALGVTFLAIVPNRVAGWVRTGFLPIVAGAFLLGLIWPYLIGGFGGLVGVFIEAVASILLVVGGVLGVAPSRGGDAAGG